MLDLLLTAFRDRTRDAADESSRLPWQLGSFLHFYMFASVSGFSTAWLESPSLFYLLVDRRQIAQQSGGRTGLVVQPRRLADTDLLVAEQPGVAQHLGGNALNQYSFDVAGGLILFGQAADDFQIDGFVLLLELFGREKARRKQSVLVAVGGALRPARWAARTGRPLRVVPIGFELALRGRTLVASFLFHGGTSFFVAFPVGARTALDGAQGCS